ATRSIFGCSRVIHRIEAPAVHERITVDYNKCIIDRSSELGHHFTTPRSGGRCMKMTMKAWLVPVLAVAAVCLGTTLAAQDKEVAKAVLTARVSLDRGLSASASHGRPISAKFEME